MRGIKGQFHLFIHSRPPCHPITNYQPQHACIHHAPSHIPFLIPSKYPPLIHPHLLAHLIILHESVLTSKFLKLLGSVFFGGFAGVGVGDGGL